MTTLDSKIKDLLVKAEQEREALVDLKEQADTQWKTNGAFLTSNDKVLKIKVLQKDQLVSLTEMVLSKQKSAAEVANVLSMSDEDKEQYSLIHGFTSSDWIADIRKRWAFLELRSREKALNLKINKIRGILSEEQIREMEYEKLLKEI